MTSIAPTHGLLLRCADAAGYGAVSMFDEDAIAPTRKARAFGAGFWRAALTLLLICA